MVGIERLPAEESPKSPVNPEVDRHRLVYSKSRVYVNPTAYARDNIPGFVSLVKRVRPDAYFTLLCLRNSMIIFQEAVNPVYLLAWIPESLLHERGTTEWDKF